jgi:cytochrome c peroxidase
MISLRTLAIVGILQHPLSSFAATGQKEPITPIEVVKPKNPRLVELGKALFFEPRLSKSGFISCNSCHNLATGGADNLKFSIGHKWNKGPINSPTVLNSKYNVAQFWDGRAKDLAEQAGGPIANPGEMGSNHTLAVEVIKSIDGYAPLFVKAFGSKDVSIDKITASIAAFEETLTTPDSKFDLWLKGKKTALNQEEKEGYQEFKNAGCIGCHNGPAVGGNSFQKLGMIVPFPTSSKSLGRFDVTGKEEDKNFFKVPTLRNVELTAPYFHDASALTLEEAVAKMAKYQLGIDLEQGKVHKIVAFLKTLTGKQPDIKIPHLPPSGPNTPLPDPT